MLAASTAVTASAPTAACNCISRLGALASQCPTPKGHQAQPAAHPFPHHDGLTYVEWPCRSFMCTMLCERKLSCLLPMGGSCSLSLVHGTLVAMPFALLSILTHGVPMEECTRNDLLRLRFCSNSSTFRECVPTLPFLVNASTMGSSFLITRSKSTMETMSRAGSSLVHSSLATLFAVRSRLKKNLMGNLSRTTHSQSFQ